MTLSDEQSRALNRSEVFLTKFYGMLAWLPDWAPYKAEIQNLRSAIQGLRPPRIMVIGRCKAGKSSLINAICGLKVATVSDTKPETGAAEWKEYYRNGSERIQIRDTRGLQEAQSPRQDDPAKTPYESIMQAVDKKCPDVILFLCNATSVHAAIKEELDICESMLAKIQQKHHRNLCVIGVLTKCDELSPPKIQLPTDNARKNRNIQEQTQSFYAYLTQRTGLCSHVKGVVPTAAYAEYEEGENGLILPDEDYRWNIDKLVETMIQHTPKETRGSLARLAHLKDFQMSVARTIVNACAAICAFVSINPIPGAAIPVVAAIQTFMVMYIGWLSGRDFSEKTVEDFVVNAAVGLGANAGMIGLADIALKFVPGLGNLLSVGAAATATKGLGDTAVAYFLQKSQVAEVVS